MSAHFVGGGPFFQKRAVPAPGSGTSLAVAQWLELVRGERVVQDPANLFRVECVQAEELYCLHCCNLHWHDVIYPVNPTGLWRRMLRCRGCGKEGFI